MLASSASLGIQKVLLTISSTLFVTILFVVILTVYLLSVWRQELFHPEISKYLSLMFVVLIFIRFSANAERPRFDIFTPAISEGIIKRQAPMTIRL